MLMIITLLFVTPSSFLSRCMCNHHHQISRRDRNGMCIAVKTAMSSCRSRMVGALLLLMLLPIALNFYLVMIISDTITLILYVLCVFRQSICTIVADHKTIRDVMIVFISFRV